MFLKNIQKDAPKKGLLPSSMLEKPLLKDIVERPIIKKEIPEMKSLETSKFRDYCRPSSKTSDRELLEGVDKNISLDSDVKELKLIQFTMLSAKDIRLMSVCEIKESRLEQAGEYSLYDSRLGPFCDSEDCGGFRKAKCATCQKMINTLNPDEDCNGHFGHIELEQPIPHPIQTDLIKKYLQLICWNCNKCIYSNEAIYTLGFGNFKNMARLDKLYKYSETLNNCYNCSSAVPKYKENKGEYWRIFKKSNLNKKIYPKEIHDMFKNFSMKEFQLMVNSPEKDIDKIHPKHLIIEALPVLPICVRLPLLNNGELQHDDLTIKYAEIIKANQKIKEARNEAQKNKYIEDLSTYIHTLFDNKNNRVKDNSNRVFKGIKQRLNGKQGRIRQNLQGKRCDFNARTVITPEAYCKADELVIPPQVANNLTYPVNVNKLNLEECRKWFREGKVKTIILKNGKCRRVDALMQRKNINIDLHPEDVIERDGNTFTIEEYEWRNKIPFEYKPSDKVYREDRLISNIMTISKDLFKNIENDIKEGNIVERYLRDGDIVLFNRQPTLWKGSMRAKKIKIRPGKTFRFALSSTSAYNADGENFQK